jgi:FAD/FMN-containing dehydrogenase
MCGNNHLSFLVAAVTRAHSFDSVPVSCLPRLVLETKKDLAQSGLLSTIVGHVGDGNFHALILFHDDKELESVSSAVHRLVNRALALDGTCGYLTYKHSLLLMEPYSHGRAWSRCWEEGIFGR